MFYRFLLAFTAVFLLCADGRAEDHASYGSDHAPIGVMGDHMHQKGEWMVSYRRSFMQMDNLRDGTDSISVAQAIAMRPGGNYAMVPVSMDMEMDMFGVMFAPSDQVTLMGMINHTKNDMTMNTVSGVASTMQSEGWGDTKIQALIRLYEDPIHHVHAHAGISLPTGSIDEKNAAGVVLPYGMQLGTGTFDALPGVTYRGKSDDLSWGAQISAQLPLNDNDRGYSVGDVYRAGVWGGLDISDDVAVSLRLAGETRGDYEGQDTSLNLAMSPLNDPVRRAGTTIDAGLGINWAIAHTDHRLGLEISAPVYENLDGPQLSTDYRAMIGWQYRF